MFNRADCRGEVRLPDSSRGLFFSPVVAILMIFGVSAPSWALQPVKPNPAVSLEAKKLKKQELQVSSTNEPLDTARKNLSSAHLNALDKFKKKHGHDFQVHLDPRSGSASNIIGHAPLIPGSGKDNKLTKKELAAQLGEAVTVIDAATVTKVSRKFFQDSKDALNIDINQLGDVVATQVNDHLWHVNGVQQVDGIKVRDARLSATINHGNLVVIGTEKWGKVKVNTKPKIDADQALEIGFQYVGGRRADDTILSQPTLEIVPTAPLHLQDGDAYVGPPGQGYEHKLVWSFMFKRPSTIPKWEIMIDAHNGEILSFRDLNQYMTSRITGGVYPLTSTEICPSPDRCGTMQANQPMPFADTGLEAPNDYTNSAGLVDYIFGTVQTTLSGRFLKIYDVCGDIDEHATGSIDLGGTNGQHDCASAGTSPGNTASARSVYYEINKLQEVARGYLPYNIWLQGRLTANVNIDETCNAYWDDRDGSINFFKSGGGCRNTGEIAAVFDHEWGHGLDYNDGNGYSSPGESYADIAALYRLQTSCIGHGFFATLNQGCGMTSDGTGYNANESQTGGYHCAEDCSGVRDADWDKHADHTPDTAANFVCTQCEIDPDGYNGPCGRQAHCESAVDRQAAWDFAARDLQAAPFKYDSNTAFLIANRIFYQSSGNIGDWHACSCSGSASNGCGATNAYMQWLAADDDDGNLNNGTPHMTAIFNAFNRHGIACSTPAPVNSGCSGAPANAPTVTVMGGDSQAGLTWNDIAGATQYQVFRSEGDAGCTIGKALIASVSGTNSYTDTGLANDRHYCYTVMAVGSSDACSSPASTCTCVTPKSGPQGTLQGIVTDLGTNDPIRGATVTVAGYAAVITDSSGLFQFAGMPVGTYEVQASAYGYQPHSPIPVEISANTATPLTISLDPFIMAIIQGDVTDGSGHNNWPLYATVAITAPGFSRTIHTDPATGHYSVSLVPGIQHTVTVSATDYLSSSRSITPPAGGATENFPLTVDGATCKAQGYSDNYSTFLYNESFENNDGGYLASQASFYPTTWAWGAPVNGPGNAHSGSHVWGTNLSGGHGSYEDGYVTSPVIDLSANAGQSSYLSWWEWLSDQYYWTNVDYTVEVSNDGGATWSVLYHPTGVGTSTWTKARLLLSPAYSVSTFRVRFRWTNSSNPGIFIDDITVAPATCSPVAGGRLVGNISDGTTGEGVIDALISDGAGHQAISTATPTDPALNNGYYSLFLPIGAATLTASRTGYESAAQSVTVVADTVTRQNFTLTPAPLTIVQGTVTDGGGHGWPLYAKIEITAPNYSQTIHTDPVTGAYSVALFGNTAFTFTVSSRDYTTTIRQITTPSGTATENFILPVAYCTALGYGDTGSGGLLYFETFEAGEQWLRTDPIWQWIIPTYGPQVAHSGAHVWGPMQSSDTNYGAGYITSPIIDLSANTGQPSSLSWWQWYSVPSTMYKTNVEVSKDGGIIWTKVYAMPADKLSETAWTRHSIQLDASYSVSTFRARFYYWGATDQSKGWYLDDVAIQSQGGCPPIPGGLVVGNVYAAATGNAINNALVTDGDGRTTTTVATADDPALYDGFYAIFLPTGARTLTALYGDTGESKHFQVAAETVSRLNFTLVKDGVLQGTVRDGSTGAPLSGATVSINQFGAATTDSSGQYAFNKLPVGTYMVTATKYGYPATPAASVTITSETSTTLDFTLTESATAILEGTVTDGSGHGWPLPARIDITAAGYSTTVQTDPITGHYSATLYLETPYAISASSPGYNSTTQNRTLSPGVTPHNIILTVDRPACNAPGYRATDSDIVTFEADNGGYTVSGTTSWAWGSPTSGPGSGHSGSQVWGTNLSGNYGNYEDGYLTSPLMDLSAYAGQSAILVWWQWLTSEAHYDFATVEISKDGGATWLGVYGPTSGAVDQAWTRHAVSLDPSYSVSTFRVRFHLTSDSYETAAGWYIDDVSIQTQSSCQPEPGGMVAGNVTAADTGTPLNNAMITDLAGHTTYSLATPELPTVADGFYSLFLPTGTKTLIASVSDYGGEQTLTVAADQITLLNFNLGKCSYALSPASAFITAAGGTGSLSVTTGSGCTWSATNVPAWLSITSAGSGMGNGTVSYSASANTGTVSRTGSFSLGDQSFSVTQESNYGGVQGVVTSAATGTPLGGALVTLSGTSLSATTDSFGYYRIDTIPVGLHDVTVSATAYEPLTLNGVTIRNDVITTQNVALNESPLVVVQGTITDGSGHGWPLYASLTITATGFNQTVHTDPVTGQYSITLYKNTLYTFTVNSSGYNATTRSVTPPFGGSTENFALPVNIATCTAPGYSGAFYSQNFEASSGGYVASGTNSSWNYGVPTSGPGNAHSGSRVWATNLRGIYNRQESSELTSPTIDLSANTGQSSVLSWWQWVRVGNFNDQAYVQVSKDGGPWSNVYLATNQNSELVWTQHTVVLDPSYSVSNFKVRFGLYNDIYYTSDTEGIYVDDISVAPASCRLLPGGLVVGNIASANTGAGLTGATISDGMGHTATTVATPNDPAVADGYFTLFVPAGSTNVTASLAGYVNDTKTVAIATDSITPLNLTLTRLGAMQGTVTDAASGNPLSGALVTATGGFTGTTGSSGFYQFVDMPPGAYDVTVSRAGYQAMTVTSVMVASDATTTRNLPLAATAPVTLQGTITDGSGHGWPLYATIDITAPGYSQKIYSNPVTGSYSISLYYGTTYTLTVNSTGYTGATRSLSLTAGGLTENFSLANSSCTALGYSGADYSATFEGTDGGFVKSGISSWALGTPTSGPGSAHSGSNVWATNLAGDYDNNENGYITSPNIDLSKNAGDSTTLSWWQWQFVFTSDQASVEASKDGGVSWTLIYSQSSANYSWTKISVTLGPEYSVKNFRVRFHFTSNNDTYRGAGWYIDDVTLRSANGCQAVAGGLVIGNVYNTNTGSGFNDATVTDGAGHTATAAATPLDPNLADGSYTLFLPTGAKTLTASFPGYLSDAKTVTVTANTVTAQNFNLVRSGILHGTVTAHASGNPISGVAVTATGGYSTTTDSSGLYQFAAIPPGTYDVTLSLYGYQSQTAAGIVISSDVTTTHDFAIVVAPIATLQGTISDGSGHGWPLYGKIDITAPGYTQTIYSDPATGLYSFNQYSDTTYTLTVSVGGYTSQAASVNLGPGGTSRDFVLTKDASCTALGYVDNNYVETFDGGTNGGFVASGSTTWAWGVPTSGPATAHSGLKVWGTRLDGSYNNNENGYLTSSTINLSGNAGKPTTLSWWQWLQSESRYDFASVEVSKDGGTSWTIVYGPVSGAIDASWKKYSVVLDPSYSVSNFRVRFHFTSDYSYTYNGWYIDDISLSSENGCQPLTGGLVVGNVYSADMSTGVNGASVTDGAGHTAISAATPLDQNLADGFYTLFLPSGIKSLTTSFPGYLNDAKTVTVAANSVIRQDFIVAIPGTLQGTVTSYATGTPINGATVTATGGHTTTTDSTGFYLLTSMQPGIYTVSVAAAGLASQSANGVVISSDVTTTQNFDLITCSFALTSSSATLNAAGGTGAIGVTATDGCGWSVTSTPGWLTITSGNSGSGNGTVNYTVLANTGTAPRTGTLTIAGQTFTISQAGTTQPYVLTTALTPPGAGTVYGNGIGCVGACSSYVGDGTVLRALANAGYQFSGWDGCDTTAGDRCTTTMAGSKSVTAHFTSCANQPVKKAASNYPTLQAAYQADGDEDIQVQAVLLEETLLFNQDKSVRITGGHDCGFSGNGSRTYVKGAMRVSNGNVRVDNLSIMAQ